MESKSSAALLGLVTAAVVSWDRQDQETQRKNRNTRDDLRDITDRFNAYIARGEQIRSRLPSVMSALLGLALANPTTASAVVLPTTTKLTRPEIGGDSVSDLSWPPKTGTFDERGNVSEIGELTRTFLAATFQEWRAWNEGLTQDKSPTLAGLTQINTAAHQMIAVLSTLNLTAAQYAAAWLKVFTGTSSQPTVDVHAASPTIGAPNGANNVASVAFVAGSAKSDRAMRLRITSGAGAISASTDVVSIAFAAEWKDSAGIPITPATVGSQGLVAINSTSTGFTIQLSVAIPPATAVEFSLIVSSGGSIAIS